MNKVVNRIYVLLATMPLSTESKCIGVMKNIPSETDLKILEKDYLSDRVTLGNIQMEKVYAISVDIPDSMLDYTQSSRNGCVCKPK
jgi:hypothetical protein